MTVTIPKPIKDAIHRLDLPQSLLLQGLLLEHSLNLVGLQKPTAKDISPVVSTIHVP